MPLFIYLFVHSFIYNF